MQTLRDPGRGLLLAIALLACGCQHRDPSAAIQPADGGSPPPSLAGSQAIAPGQAATASPRDRDPRWIRARDEDPAERRRLADAVGAAGLLEGLDDGGDNAQVALAAIPFADDADLALGKLADLAQAADPARRTPILEAILAIAGRPRRPRELLDPEGARRSADILVALARRADLPPEDRAIAVSSLRALAEKGYVDPARIPTDLDPK